MKFGDNERKRRLFEWEKCLDNSFSVENSSIGRICWVRSGDDDVNERGESSLVGGTDQLDDWCFRMWDVEFVCCPTALELFAREKKNSIEEQKWKEKFLSHFIHFFKLNLMWRNYFE